MNKLLLSLVLLSGSAVSATLLPYEPTPEANSFYLKADAQVVLCAVGSPSLCSEPKTIKGDATQQLWNNCGLTFTKPVAPAGSTFECRPYVAPPVVPTVTIPEGWSKVGDYCSDNKCTFDVSTRMDIKLCDIDYLKCSSPITLLKAPGVHYICGKENFPDFAVGVVPFICIGKPNPTTYIDIELPDFTDTKNYAGGTVPDGISDVYTRYGVWKGATTGKIQFRFASLSEWAEASFVIVVQKLAKDNAAINTWAKTLSLEEITQKENDFAKTIIAQFKDTFAVKYAVQTSSSGTRPYYTANAAGTGTGVKKGDVAVNTACDGSQRLGTTNYYVVPSVSLPTAKYYSACVIIK